MKLLHLYFSPLCMKMYINRFEMEDTSTSIIYRRCPKLYNTCELFLRCFEKLFQTKLIKQHICDGRLITLQNVISISWY